jgi:hypothetical protein
VAVLHVSLIVGACLVATTGSHVSALILLVLLKIGLDIRGYLKERAGFSAEPSTSRHADAE